MAIVDDIAGLRRILTRSRVIAVVGLSAHWYRPSYFAAKYMQEHGYRVIPVNPTQAEILGERSYPSLDAVPEAIDIVDCFRAPSQIEPIARAAIAKGAKVLWMQLGIRNDDAARIACEAGLDVVMNRCVKIEHGRLMGGLHWAGVNTGVISARRGGQHEPDGGHPGPLPSSAADGAASLQCGIPAARQSTGCDPASDRE